MPTRSRTKQLAKRVEKLLAAIRGEIEASSASSALQAVGVLTFLEEAAALLNHAGLRMGWWISESEPESTRPGKSGPEGVLTGDEVYAAFRYVAVQAPSLAPALAWAAAASPELLAALGARPPTSGELAALAALDETLEAIVEASPAGIRRSGRVWRQRGEAHDSEAPAPPPGSPLVTATAVARSVMKVAELRPSLVPAHLWWIQHQAAARLAVRTLAPKPEELTELSELTRQDAEDAEDAEAETGEAGRGSGSLRITGAEAKGSLVSLAVKLDKRRAEVEGLIHGLFREWPDSIGDTQPPDLEFSLFGAAENVAELLDEAIARAWEAADLTAEGVRLEWEAQQRAWKAERKELLSGFGNPSLLRRNHEASEDRIVEVTQDVETRVLPEVMEDLTRAREKILAARRRLPRKYPELATGELSRPAVLHGDLSILVSTLDEALAQAQTAVSGVLQE